MGSPLAFALAVLIIVVWAASGPVFHFSDTWQLVINTGTTIVTFLMVFLIQSTQNRDSSAIHIKLDELIRATKGAQNMMISLESLDEKELDRFRKKFDQLAEAAREIAGEVEEPEENEDGGPVREAQEAQDRR